MMTDPYQHHEDIYKAIIALNNTGVYLIEHGLYNEAIETLNDSMRFMKETFFPTTTEMGQMTPVASASSSNNNAGTRTNTVTARSEYETALQAAYSRKSLVNHRRHCNEEMSGTNPVGIRIVVVSDQDHPSEVHDTLMQQCCNDTSFCCVTIDHVPRFDVLGSNFDPLQQETALILYNLGISYRCVAVTHRPIVAEATDSNNGERIALTTCTSLHLEHFTTSFQFMELSQTITSSMLRELQLRGVALVNAPLNLLLVSLQVLYNLQQMSNENEYLVDKHLQYSIACDNIISLVAARTSMMTGEVENQMKSKAPAA